MGPCIAAPVAVSRTPSAKEGRAGAGWPEGGRAETCAWERGRRREDAGGGTPETGARARGRRSEGGSDETRGDPDPDRALCGGVYPNYGRAIAMAHFPAVRHLGRNSNGALSSRAPLALVTVYIIC